jgi:RNA polymerase sigma-70 factor (ECF subfamily)
MAVHKGWLRDQLKGFEGPLLRYASRLTGDLESARDVVQDTFLRLCRQPPEQLEQLNGHLRPASVAALPPRQREMVHLKFSEGLSYKEIANITGASVSNVGFILHTAIKSLRQRMAAYARSEA